MNNLKIWEKELITELNEMINQLSDPKRRTDAIISYILNNYKLIGICELLTSHNHHIARQYFYKSGQVGMIEFLAMQGKLPIKGDLRFEFNTNGIRVWPAVLLSDSPLLWQDFANALTIQMTSANEKLLGNQISLSLKYYLLSDIDEAKYWTDKALNNKEKAQELSGYATALSGLIQKDTLLVNKGIEQQLSWYKHTAAHKQLVYYAVNISATALALLAKRRGIDADLTSSFVHTGLIEHTDSIIYEEIDNVYSALEKALNPPKTLFDNFKNSFKSK